MVDEFHLDPAGLARSTRDLRRAGERMLDALADLNRTLDHNDKCWGTDDIGKAFDKKYSIPAGDVRLESKADADAFVGVADVTNKNAEFFQGLDHDSAQRMDRTPPPDPPA